VKGSEMLDEIIMIISHYQEVTSDLRGASKAILQVEIGF
jgi:hypothetical protein